MGIFWEIIFHEKVYQVLQLHEKRCTCQVFSTVANDITNKDKLNNQKCLQDFLFCCCKNAK